MKKILYQHKVNLGFFVVRPVGRLVGICFGVFSIVL